MTVLVEVIFGDIGSLACQKNCAPLESCYFAFAEQSLPFFDLSKRRKAGIPTRLGSRLFDV